MTDKIDEYRETKEGELLLDFEVGGYGLTIQGETGEDIHGNGIASVQLNKAEARKLKQLLDQYLDDKLEMMVADKRDSYGQFHSGS